jgi:hypothetical protein
MATMIPVKDMLKEMFCVGRPFKRIAILLPLWEETWMNLQEMDEDDELDDELKWMEPYLREVMLSGPTFVDKSVVRPYYQEMWNDICEGFVK